MIWLSLILITGSSLGFYLMRRIVVNTEKNKGFLNFTPDFLDYYVIILVGVCLFPIAIITWIAMRLDGRAV